MADQTRGAHQLPRVTTAADDDLLILADPSNGAMTAIERGDFADTAFADTTTTLYGVVSNEAVSPAGLANALPHVDVRSKGAVGNGTTNDTSSIQAACDAVAAAGDDLLILADPSNGAMSAIDAADLVGLPASTAVTLTGTAIDEFVTPAGLKAALPRYNLAAFATVQDAASAVCATGGTLFCPAGIYTLTSTVTFTSTHPVWLEGDGAPSMSGSSDHGTIFRCAADTIAVKFNAPGGIRNVCFDGKDGSGNNAGAIGLVVGAVHRVHIIDVTCRFFDYAGFVTDGTQNSTFTNIDSSGNFINIWVTGLTTNCVFVNANTTEWPDTSRTVPPNGRQIFVGPRTQSYLAMPTSGDRQCPALLTFMRGIFERAGSHTYNTEIARCWGRIAFYDCQFHGAISSPIRLGSGVVQGVETLDVVLDRAASDCVTGSTPIPFVTSGYPVTSDALRVYATDPIHYAGSGNWGARVREAITSEDYGAFKNVLAAPTTFGYAIGSWTSSGGSGGASHQSATRRLRATVTADGFGATCGFQLRYHTLGAGTTFPLDAARFAKVKYHCTALNTVTSVKVSMGLVASPWTRDVGTISATGEGEFLYDAQGDEYGSVLITGTANGYAEFAYFAVTVY